MIKKLTPKKHRQNKAENELSKIILPKGSEMSF